MGSLSATTLESNDKSGHENERNGLHREVGIQRKRNWVPTLSEAYVLDFIDVILRVLA
jgi:hypothetical protein